ncbi:MAG: GNAT family N-acetyltransferase [Pyrodictiaceae archaeon]
MSRRELEDMIIRRAEEKDVDALVDFIVRLKQVNEELDPTYIVRDDVEEVARRYIKESLGRDDVIILVAEHNGRPIAMVRAELRERLFYEPRREALITDLYVHPSYRRRGIGEKLVRSLESILVDKGIRLLAAEYPPGNTIASRFFEKEGFKKLLVRVYRRLS